MASSASSLSRRAPSNATPSLTSASSASSSSLPLRRRTASQPHDPVALISSASRPKSGVASNDHRSGYTSVHKYESNSMSAQIKRKSSVPSLPRANSASVSSHHHHSHASGMATHYGTQANAFDFKRLLSKPARPTTYASDAGSDVSSLYSSYTGASSSSPRVGVASPPSSSGASLAGRTDRSRSRAPSPSASEPGAGGSASTRSKRSGTVSARPPALRPRASRTSLHNDISMPALRARASHASLHDARTPTAATFGSVSPSPLPAPGVSPVRATGSNIPRLPAKSPKRTTSRSLAPESRIPAPVPALPSHARKQPDLTPAGAVVRAYKEQERRRSQLEILASGAALPSPAPFSDITAPTKMTDEDEETRSAQPYYTIFGATSGRVVAVGSPEDVEYSSRSSSEARIASARKSASDVGRSLSRKVSSRWTRKKEDPSAGAMTIQERRSMGVASDRKKALRLEADEFGRAKAVHGEEPVKTPRSARVLTKERPVEKPKNPDDNSPSPGGKIWKLMKRISTGGLKDRYIAGDAPPVPELPTGLSRATKRATYDPRVLAQQEPHRSATAPTPLSSAVTKIPPYPPRAPSAITAGSNSPVPSSSEGRSSETHYFRGTHSATSSSSSYGELIPPRAAIPVAMPSPSPSARTREHIIPRDELARLDIPTDIGADLPPRGRVRARRDRPEESTPPPRSAADVPIQHSLLPPPRRHTAGNLSGANTPPQSRGRSPTMPSFSTAEAINAFPPRRERRPHNGPGVAIPPATSAAGDRSPGAAPHSAEPSTPARGARPPRSVGALTSSTSMSAGSSSRPASPRRRARSQSRLPSDSPVTFREFGTPAVPRRTEKEKMDMWDELLSRSERAGGTLHVDLSATDELLSDHIRLSAYSELML